MGYNRGSIKYELCDSFSDRRNKLFYLYRRSGGVLMLARTISTSYATGSVTGGTGTDNSTGGLVGRNSDSGTMIACYATASVTGGNRE